MANWQYQYKRYASTERKVKQPNEHDIATGRKRVYEKRCTHVPGSDWPKSVRWSQTGNGSGFTLAAQITSMKIAMVSQQRYVPILRERDRKGEWYYKSNAPADDSQINRTVIYLPRAILKWLTSYPYSPLIALSLAACSPILPRCRGDVRLQKNRSNVKDTNLRTTQSLQTQT